MIPIGPILDLACYTCIAVISIDGTVVTVAIIGGVVTISQALIAVRVKALAGKADHAELQAENAAEKAAAAKIIVDQTHELAQKTEIQTNSINTELRAEVTRLKTAVEAYAASKDTELAAVKAELAGMRQSAVPPLPADKVPPAAAPAEGGKASVVMKPEAYKPNA